LKVFQMTRIRNLALAAVLLISCLPSANADDINRRLERQSGRIQNGKKHHKLSPEEQARRDEATYRVASEEMTMRGKHNGKLTRRDRRQLNRELNRNSRRIRNGKNNG
jgi:hypothetical protein